MLKRQEVLSPFPLFPSSLFPSSLFPSSLFPSSLFPSSLFPSPLFPLLLFPSSLLSYRCFLYLTVFVTDITLLIVSLINFSPNGPKPRSLTESLRQKQKIINSLRNCEHEYFSFFVCRNPVAKLISIYNYQKTRSSSKYTANRGPHTGVYHRMKSTAHFEIIYSAKAKEKIQSQSTDCSPRYPWVPLGPSTNLGGVSCL